MERVRPHEPADTSGSAPPAHQLTGTGRRLWGSSSGQSPIPAAGIPLIPAQIGVVAEVGSTHGPPGSPFDATGQPKRDDKIVVTATLRVEAGVGMRVDVDFIIHELPRQDARLDGPR